LNITPFALDFYANTSFWSDKIILTTAYAKLTSVTFIPLKPLNKIIQGVSQKCNYINVLCTDYIDKKARLQIKVKHG